MEQFEFALLASQTLASLGIRHALVGSLAGMSYGEARLTRDIDFLVELADSQVEPLCDRFPRPDYYVSPKAAHDAVRFRTQFNVIHIPSGNKLDLMMTKPNDWSRAQLDRVRSVQMAPGMTVPTAAPEDIVLAKLWYFQEGGSHKHVNDIIGMFKHSASQIDRAYIDRWVPELGLSNEWRMIQDALT